MRSEKSLIELISGGESERVEFKPSLSQMDKIMASISAFSNNKGGTILIGVSDKGEVAGVDVGKNTLEDLANYIKRNSDPPLYPSIGTARLEGKTLLLVEVSESPEKPVFFKDKAYKRVGKSNQRIASSEIRKMAKEEKKILNWDERICEGATLEDIDEEKVKWYLEERENARNISKEIKIPVAQFLQNIKSLEGDKPTNAGILFFGKVPQRFLPNARLRVVKFKGTKVIHPTLDTANCEGTIWEMVNTAEDFIRKNIRLLGTRTEKSFRREDKFEYPITALREAVVNALIHRNYLETGDVRVFIFDDRVEIINPGTFPKGVTPEKPVHKPVNEVISQQVYDIGFIDKYGSGIYMMNDLSEKWGNKEPYYDLHPLETKIIFESQIQESTYIEIPDELNERQKKALYFAQKKGFITRKEYVEINNISHETAHKELKDMVEKEFLIREGKGRSVKYISKVDD